MTNDIETYIFMSNVDLMSDNLRYLNICVYSQTLIVRNNGKFICSCDFIIIKHENIGLQINCHTPTAKRKNNFVFNKKQHYKSEKVK